MASTVVITNSPAPGSAASIADASPISHSPTLPTREGVSRSSCSARRSRAERKNAGLFPYQRSTRSRKPFQTDGNRASAAGSASDQPRSSTTSRSVRNATAPPHTTSTSVVTTAAAKLRRTFKRRRSRSTAGSAKALSPSASRNGSSGVSRYWKNTSVPASHSRVVIVLLKKTSICCIWTKCTPFPGLDGQILSRSATGSRLCGGVLCGKMTQHKDM